MVEVGRSAGFPGDHVVDATVFELDVAVGVGTGAVHRTQCPALLPVGEPLAAPDVEHLTHAAEDDGKDVAVAAQPTDRLDRQRVAVGCFTGRTIVQPVEERVVVDEHGDLGDPLVGGAGAGDQVDDSIRLELVEREVGVLVVGSGRRDRGVDRGPHRSIGFGVQLDQCFAHPGLPVDPALTRRALR